MNDHSISIQNKDFSRLEDPQCEVIILIWMFLYNVKLKFRFFSGTNWIKS